MFTNNHTRSIGDTFWENIRCATGYSQSDFADLAHVSTSDDMKPCIETLDLVDTTWTEKSAIQKLRDDLDLHLKHRSTFLDEKLKRDNLKFKTRNFITDKNFEAVKERDRASVVTSADVLHRFTRIDFSQRQIKITDEATMASLGHVKELVLADNDINFVTCLPPKVQLAVLSSNQIHRIQLSVPAAHLVALSMAGNCLSNLGFVDQLPSLACLDVSYNCIPAPIEANVACSQVAEHKNLQELHLQGNPLCISSLDWRKKVETALKNCGSQIKNLDGKPVASTIGVNNLTTLSSSRKPSTSIAAENNNNNNISENPSSNGYSDLSILFQLLNVRGISDLTQKFFDLASASSSALSTFLTPTILDSFNYQFTSPNQLYGGLNMILANNNNNNNNNNNTNNNQNAVAAGTSSGAQATNNNNNNIPSSTPGVAASGANKKATSAQQQQQQAAALAANPALGNPGLQATHEAILNQWCKEISTSLSLQLLWMNDDQQNAKQRRINANASRGRVLNLDELMSLGGATNSSGEDLTEDAAAPASGENNNSQGKEDAENARGNNKKNSSNATAAGGAKAKSATSAGKEASSSKTGSNAANQNSKTGGGAGGSKQDAKEATAAALREQQLQHALQLASSEFVLPNSCPTLSREVMLPARLGLVLTVVPANSAVCPIFSALYNNNVGSDVADANTNNNNNNNSSTKETPPTATLGWASLSPAELVTGYTTTTTATGIKLGVDRATLLTSRERVNKLRQQLIQIRTSLEKEIAENSWRRDTEQAILMAQSDRGAKSGKLGAMEKSMMSQNKKVAAAAGGGGGTSARGAVDAGFSPAPVNPALSGHSAASLAQIQSEMEIFFQNQIALRRRAEETYKKLAVEIALLNVLIGLSEVANGKVVVDGKFKIQKASSEALKKVSMSEVKKDADVSAADMKNNAGDVSEGGLSPEDSARMEAETTKKGASVGNKGKAAVTNNGAAVKKAVTKK